MSSLYIAVYSCIFVPGLLQTTFALTLVRVRAVCAGGGVVGGRSVEGETGREAMPSGAGDAETGPACCVFSVLRTAQ